MIEFDQNRFAEIEVGIEKVPSGRLVIGGVLSRVYPHETSTGAQHEGNMKIYWASMNGELGSAKCVLCERVVRLVLKK